MASSALASQGVLIQRGSGTTVETFTTIAEIISFSGPQAKMSEVDVTSLDSTAKEFRMGLVDNGEFTFECNLVPGDAAQTGLRTDQAAKSLRNFKLSLNDATATKTHPTTLAFAAYVSQFAIKGGVDARITASVSLRISGAVTWTAAY